MSQTFLQILYLWFSNQYWSRLPIIVTHFILQWLKEFRFHSLFQNHSNECLEADWSQHISCASNKNNLLFFYLFYCYHCCCRVSKYLDDDCCIWTLSQFWLTTFVTNEKLVFVFEVWGKSYICVPVRIHGYAGVWLMVSSLLSHNNSYVQNFINVEKCLQLL